MQRMVFFRVTKINFLFDARHVVSRAITQRVITLSLCWRLDNDFELKINISYTVQHTTGLRTDIECRLTVQIQKIEKTKMRRLQLITMTQCDRQARIAERRGSVCE